MAEGANGTSLATPPTAWSNGKSGNPRGRPARSKEQKDQRELFAAECRKLWPSMLNQLKSIALDREQKTNDRLAAIRMVLHWAFGKPVQSVEVDVEVNQIFDMPEHERASRLQAIIALAEERKAAEERRNLEGTATVVDVIDELAAKAELQPIRNPVPAKGRIRNRPRRPKPKH
jgi:hypothetical protein